MCGIIGLLDLAENEERFRSFKQATEGLQHRGTDHQGTVISPPFALGHRRLSIIDLEERSHQPMTDPSGRYTLVFNGEIYNFQQLKQELEQEGIAFQTESDTEVLLHHFILNGKRGLSKLNGFFAFGFIDRQEKTLTVVRDRFGIKPLVYHWDGNTFAFSSELRGLMDLQFQRRVDKVALFTYFKFNYIPAPQTILEDHFKLEPGCLIELNWGSGKPEMKMERWYEIPYDPADEKNLSAHDYQQAQKVLKRFMRESVRRRLVADVPLGTFLSGGIDSSIITALAAQEQKNIASFSIGFPDRPYYDESKYAVEVAKHLGVEHHLLPVTDQDLMGAAQKVIQHLDEPFADSSALNVHLLSEFTRKHVKVALSGDGGDELFAGYHKHGAEFRLRHPKFIDHLVGKSGALWNSLPASRSGKMGNTIRQLQKYARGYNMNSRDRYWRWAGILSEEEANFFLKEEMLEKTQRLSDAAHLFKKHKEAWLKNIKKEGSLNEVLLTDMQMVLSNDMLFKVDSMLMAHGLEVRTPFLDQHVVKHAFRLPIMFKVNSYTKKKILHDAYADMLPSSVFNRSKKGFEVPLLEWFQGPMKGTFTALCENREAIEDQGLFNVEAVQELKKRLYSSNPGDAPATAWAFYVFQNWYERSFT